MGLLPVVVMTSTGGVSMVILGYFEGILSNGWTIALFGACLLCFVAFLSRFLGPTNNPFTLVFIVFGFTCAVDGVIACSIAGLTGAADFYLRDGEPYFKNGHGFAINAWDCLVHWPLVLALSQGVENSVVSGLWAGSILNSMPVFLLAAFSTFSDSISPAILLNIPYIVAPALYLVWIVNQGPPVRRWVVSRRARIFMIALCALHQFRLASVAVLPWMADEGSFFNYAVNVEPFLLSSDGFPFFQLAVYSAIHVPLMGYALLSRAVHPALLGAWCGATLQGQFAYAVSSLWQPQQYGLRLLCAFPSITWFAIINAFIAMVPLFSIWTAVVESSAKTTKGE